MIVKLQLCPIFGNIYKNSSHTNSGFASIYRTSTSLVSHQYVISIYLSLLLELDTDYRHLNKIYTSDHIFPRQTSTTTALVRPLEQPVPSHDPQQLLTCSGKHTEPSTIEFFDDHLIKGSPKLFRPFLH